MPCRDSTGPYPPTSGTAGDRQCPLGRSLCLPGPNPEAAGREGGGREGKSGEALRGRGMAKALELACFLAELSPCLARGAAKQGGGVSGKLLLPVWARATRCDTGRASAAASRGLSSWGLVQVRRAVRRGQARGAERPGLEQGNLVATAEQEAAILSEEEPLSALSSQLEHNLPTQHV